MEASILLSIHCWEGLNSTNQNELSLRKLTVTKLKLSKEQPTFTDISFSPSLVFTPY